MKIEDVKLIWESPDHVARVPRAHLSRTIQSSTFRYGPNGSDTALWSRGSKFESW